MAKDARRDAPHDAGRAPPSLGRSMARMGSVGIGSAAWLGAAWTRRVADAAVEVARFAGHRLGDDLRTQAEMLRCRDLAALQSVQGRFLQRAIDEYAAETARLMRLGGDAPEPRRASTEAEGPEDAPPGARSDGRGRAYDNIPL